MSSKMIARRIIAKMLITKETVEQAVREANAIAEQLMDVNPNDPVLDKISAAADRLSALLNTGDDSNFDDAMKPQEASQAKLDVDTILAARQATRSKEAPMASVAATNGNDGFVTDRDDKGQPRAPEVVEVPRVAAKKKKEAEEPAASAAPAATPAAPVSSINAIDYIPTETLIKVIEDMPKEEDFAQNKNKQDALIELTNVLKARPVLPPEPVEGEAATPAAPAPAAPVASLKQAGFRACGLCKGEGKWHNGQLCPDCGGSGQVYPRQASAPPGWEGTVKEMKKENGIDNPYALAWSMKNKGYTPHAANWLLKRKGASYIKDKFASANGGGGFTSNNETMDVEEGKKVPEIAQAHGLRDDKTGITRPSTELPSKFAGEMSAKQALKASEDAQEKLKALYLDVKPLTTANNTRDVRQAVESVYAAYSAFEAAVKTLNKQVMQEEEEEKAAQIVDKKKKSSLGGLTLVAMEEDECKTCKKPQTKCVCE
jgi:hypothetical protein